jgi:2-oxoglutarate dehydrogenase E1 component
MSPKKLLRLPEARSSLADMVEGTSFQRFIPEPSCFDSRSVKRLIFCSGKIYYELVKQREAKGLTNDVAIARIEQISPFPYDKIIQEMDRFPNADLLWVQEESKNMGAWSYVRERLETSIGSSANTNKTVKYVGRSPSAGVATGTKATHTQEEQTILFHSFNI